MHCHVTLINSYERDYFVSAEEDFRLTLDSNIFNYSPYLNLNKTSNIKDLNQEYILEMKYDIRNQIHAHMVTNTMKLRVEKNSKYVNGIKEINTIQ